MATRQNLTLRERNDETIAMTITAGVDGYDLATVTVVEFYLKIDPCYGDDDLTTVLLSSSDAAQVVITAQDATTIEATVQVPAAALAGSYDRFYRLDAMVGALRHTALFGTVTVVEL